MNLKIVVGMLLAIACVSVRAQDRVDPGKAVYLELGGKGFVSANVDFPIDSKSRLTVGLTVLDHEFEKEHPNDEHYPVITAPTPGLMYFQLVGKEKHYFEVGGGFSVSPFLWKTFSENDSPLSFHGCIGYRYQVPDKFFFRAGLTPFYRVNWMFLPLAGVSLGYSW